MSRTRTHLFLLTVILAALGISPARADSGEQYLGRWNYDSPDRATMTNYAVMNLGEGVAGPQIGDIVFTAGDSGRVTGRTDVGCTWRFRIGDEGLTLDPPGQTCHNPTSNSSYTMTSWSVRVRGDHEEESIRAVSHHQDRDYEFTLERGTRTRVAEYDPAAAAAFAGSWTYAAPRSGTVTLAVNHGNRLTARTGDGCEWTLLARGNTAKLDPPAQSCTVGDAAVALSFWTLAVRGDHQFSVMNGTGADGKPLAVDGELTRR